MAVSPILDHRGQPFDRTVLAEEISGPLISGVRNIQSGHPAQGLTPARITALLREAEEGDWMRYCELAEEMEEKDLHYLSVLSTRKRAVSQLDIRVEPGADTPEARKHAALVEKWLERDTLQIERFDVLDAIGKGASFTEIIWDFQATGPDGAQVWLPGKLKWRLPQWFEFDRIDGETPLLRDEGGMPRPLPAFKFITHVHGAKSGLPVRGGLARAAAWGYLFKNYAIRDWVSFLEVFGKPIRTGRYDLGAAEGDIRKLMRAVAQLGQDASAVYPRSMDMEIISASGGTSPKEMWLAKAQYWDEQFSKAVLGQTSSSDAKAGGLGSGQADLHGDVRDDIANADGVSEAATYNRDLVRPIIDLNYGPQAVYPRLMIEKPKPVEIKTEIEAAEKLAGMGVEIDAEEMRERAGLPAPKSADAKLLKVPSQTMGQNSPQEALQGQDGPLGRKNGSPALFGASLRAVEGDKADPSTRSGQRGDARAVASAAEPAAPAGIDDPIARATDEALGDWDEIFDALVDPLVEQLASASSIDQARDMLAEAAAQMPDAKVREMLARLGFAAALAGEVDVALEQGNS
jgi:phage gp29-like protein